MTNKEIKLLSFDHLTGMQIYSILQARSAVFVFEQECAYQDIDGIDVGSVHVLIQKTLPKNLNHTHPPQSLMAYCRIIPPNIRNKYSPAIGRVLVLPEYRRKGLAKALMVAAIEFCQKQYPNCKNIDISAQTYLISFYESLGFMAIGDAYLEDGIKHIDMTLSK